VSLIVAGIIATLALLAALYGFRARRLMRTEAKLTRLVEERTAELRERTAQLEVANAALEELATVDSLTGLANRRRFDVFIQHEWQRAHRSQQPLSLLLVDADRFKLFNDRYGHLAGDDGLRQIADVLRLAAHRASDLAARYGGEEFAVVLANTDLAGAMTVAEGIRARVAALAIPHADAPEGVITVSAGVATDTKSAENGVTQLIGAADRALYEAKRGGRNRVVASRT
jgi:two-component system chemotaxis family response regulator WspR